MSTYITRPARRCLRHAIASVWSCQTSFRPGASAVTYHVLSQTKSDSLKLAHLEIHSFTVLLIRIRNNFDWKAERKTLRRNTCVNNGNAKRKAAESSMWIQMERKIKYSGESIYIHKQIRTGVRSVGPAADGPAAMLLRRAFCKPTQPIWFIRIAFCIVWGGREKRLCIVSGLICMLQVYWFVGDFVCLYEWWRTETQKREKNRIGKI